MLDVQCPKCKRVYHLSYDPETVIGKGVVCKTCGFRFVVGIESGQPPAIPPMGAPGASWEPPAEPADTVRPPAALQSGTGADPASDRATNGPGRGGFRGKWVGVVTAVVLVVVVLGGAVLLDSRGVFGGEYVMDRKIAIDTVTVMFLFVDGSTQQPVRDVDVYYGSKLFGEPKNHRTVNPGDLHVLMCGRPSLMKSRLFGFETEVGKMDILLRFEHPAYRTERATASDGFEFVDSPRRVMLNRK